MGEVEDLAALDRDQEVADLETGLGRRGTDLDPLYLEEKMRDELHVT